MPYPLDSKTKNLIIISFVSIILSLWGCEGNMGANFIPTETDMALVTDDAIKVLTNKKLYFGHMSVGNNIVDGIEDIKTTGKRFSKIRIQQLGETESPNEPGLYHGKIGYNDFPKKKCDSFKKRLMEDRFGSRMDIVFFKFCFVDIQEHSDVTSILNYYTETVNYVKNEFPELTIVHVTVPLQIHSWGFQDMIGHFMRGNLANIRRGVSFFKRNLTSGDIANIKRNEFNELLVNTYKDIDPIYDLAKAESTLPDGERVTFKHNGTRYFSLATQYASDGGHLNKSGRFYAARELLATLASIR